MMAAAALAGPVDPVSRDSLSLPPENPDPAEVMAILRVNKVPLMDLEPLDRQVPPRLAPILRSNIWNESVSRERAERDALAAEFAEVSHRLLTRGITPVLFKSAGGIPYRSSNVDLLVRPTDMKAAARC